MPAPHEIDPRLAAFRDPERPARLRAGVASLPESSAVVARAMFRIDEEGRPLDWGRVHQAFAIAGRVLASMGDGERRDLYDFAFGRLAPAIDRWHAYAAALPGLYGGRPFRNAAGSESADLARVQSLSFLHGGLAEYDGDLAWLVEYGAAMPRSDLAAAVVAADPEDEIAASVRDNFSRRPSAFLARALLGSAREDAWAFAADFLLAAQRQEGLRSLILDALGAAHLGAFRRMLRLILDENLLRFAATVKAANGWFGRKWTVRDAGEIRAALGRVLRQLADPDALAHALRTETGESLHYALWSAATISVGGAVAAAAAMRTDADVCRRFVALRTLIGLGGTEASRVAVGFIGDEDLRIAARAMTVGRLGDPTAFDDIVRFAERLPAKKVVLPAPEWPAETTTVEPSDFYNRLYTNLGDRPATALLPYLARMSGGVRAHCMGLLAAARPWPDAVREVIVSGLVGRDGSTRQAAAGILKGVTLTDAETARVEGKLTAASGDMRATVVTFLVAAGDRAALASADRLVAKKNANQRLAGLTILRDLFVANRSAAGCRERAEAFRAANPETADAALGLLETILGPGERPTLANAFGLMDPAELTPVIPPLDRGTLFVSPAAYKCLEQIEALIATHAAEPFTVETSDGPAEVLLGNADYRFPGPEILRDREEQLKRLPLAEVWLEWDAARGPETRDADGCELLRAIHWPDPKYAPQTAAAYGGRLGEFVSRRGFTEAPPPAPAGRTRLGVVGWLLWLKPPPEAPRVLLDWLESAFALVAESERTRVVRDDGRYGWEQQDWRYDKSSPIRELIELVEGHMHSYRSPWTDAERVRLWELMRWRDRPAANVRRCRPGIVLHYDFVNRLGLLKGADLFDYFLGPEAFHGGMHSIDRLGASFRADAPYLSEAFARMRERLLDIELARGENTTEATSFVRAILTFAGLDVLVRVHRALGAMPYDTGYHGSRRETFTGVVANTVPNADDTPEVFAETARREGWDRARLLRLGWLSPLWLPHVGYALSLPDLLEARMFVECRLVTYFGGYFRFFDREADTVARLEALREKFAYPKADQERGDFALSWFRDLVSRIGEDVWHELAAVALELNPAVAVLIDEANVALGRTSAADLLARIEAHDEAAVRLLALAPFAGGDLDARYRALKAYRRHVASLRPSARESPQAAFDAALAHLVRAAGYADPLRLEWAMEARDLAPLAAGPMSVTLDGVTVSLSLVDGEPALAVRRGDRELKDVPDAVKKRPQVAELLERRADLRRMASATRKSLEAMMCRGETFTGAELRSLMRHPLLAPELRRLVLIGDAGAGYPTDAGLVDHAGVVHAVEDVSSLRVAHCADLYAAGEWHAWQAECFRAARVQPFKQVFRELYLPTPQELADGRVSRRYAGLQVNPSQAAALWRSRGWESADHAPTKSYPEAGLAAQVSFADTRNPLAAVEGPTIDAVRFLSGTTPVNLAAVPPRVFSEAMRDGDLVVSVAHAGGVDPEAASGTVEMRAALVRETAALLSLAGVSLRGSHALIRGTLGEYAVHLGSGVAHRVPGAALALVGVHGQHRGRLFLPFADDDPRTAEVVAAVLLLARDAEILDPAIRAQLG